MLPHRGKEKLFVGIMILAFAFLFLLVACTVPSSEEAAPTASDSPQASENTGGTDISNFSAQLELPMGARAGDSIPLKLRITNNSQHPAKLTLGGRPPYDFRVTTEDDTEIWRWLHGQFSQAILEERILKPGEELVFATEWQQVNNSGDPIPPGTYWVQAVLNLDPPAKLQTEPEQLLITSR